MADASAEAIQVRDRLRAAVNRQKFRRMDFFSPYPKQQEFFLAGATKRERLLRAGNQLGKTMAGSFEAACHLTGQYPTWWRGRRWERPTHGWAAGAGGLLTRDGVQRLLFGTPGVITDFGTGMVPKDCIVDVSTARGVTDLYDTVQVKHATGGISTIKLKSYDQGRGKFQTDTIDWFWGDEEPPEDIYGELMARITATRGMGWVTFTPLLGRTALVARFLDEESPDRADINMTMEDVGHISADERATIIAGYAPHERAARARGVPMMGEGLVFGVAEETILEPRIEHVPMHWHKIWGMDFGIAHPFAAVLMAWDKDYDVIHVLHTLRMADGNAIMHGAAMRAVAAAIPAAWPQDGTQRDKGSGDQLAMIYRKQGKIPMLGVHATHEDGSVSTEAGIMEMETRMQTGRFKVAEHLTQWREEYRGYHRKDGLIVKVHDDIMSATRTGVTMRRFAKPLPLGPGGRPKTWQGLPEIARDVDFDLS